MGSENRLSRQGLLKTPRHSKHRERFSASQLFLVQYFSPKRSQHFE
jgi:hypothetical protein